MVTSTILKYILVVSQWALFKPLLIHFLYDENVELLYVFSVEYDLKYYYI